MRRKLRKIRCPICASEFDYRLPVCNDFGERMIVKVEGPVCRSKFEVVMTTRKKTERRENKK